MSTLKGLFIVLFLIVFHITGTANASEARVLFVNPGGATGFWGEVSKTMRAAASDLDMKLEILNADRRQGYMEALLKERLADGNTPEYLVLVNELQEGARLLKLVEGMPIKVLFLLNRLTPQQENALGSSSNKQIIGSIVPDNEDAGFEMAKAAIAESRKFRPGEKDGRLLALTGDDSTPAALDRQVGMERAVADDGNIHLIGAVPVNWDRDAAYYRAKHFLNSTHIDVIWGANDDIALGAARAATELGLVPGKDVMFVGLNWSKPGMEAVQRKEMVMTHGGHFFAGAWAIVMLYDYHNRQIDWDTSHNKEFKMSAITAENVEMFLDRLGDGRWGKIDFSKFSQIVTGRRHYDFSTQSILQAASQ